MMKAINICGNRFAIDSIRTYSAVRTYGNSDYQYLVSIGLKWSEKTFDYPMGEIQASELFRILDSLFSVNKMSFGEDPINEMF